MKMNCKKLKVASICNSTWCATKPQKQELSKLIISKNLVIDNSLKYEFENEYQILFEIENN